MDNIKNELNQLLSNSIKNDQILSSQYKRMFTVNLIKKRCQHIVWHLLHSFSVFYPINPSDIQKQNTKELLLKIKKYMPFCNSCANNGADNFVENSDLELSVSCKTELIKFLIEYHKFININFAKYENYDESIYTVEFVINKYSDGIYLKYIEEKYNISFLKIIDDDISYLKNYMDNLQDIVVKEINNINYKLCFSIIISE